MSCSNRSSDQVGILGGCPLLAGVHPDHQDVVAASCGRCRYGAAAAQTCLLLELSMRVLAEQREHDTTAGIRELQVH